MSDAAYRIADIRVGINRELYGKVSKMDGYINEINKVLRKQPPPAKALTRRQLTRLLKRLRLIAIGCFRALNNKLLEQGYYRLEKEHYLVLVLDENNRVLGYVGGFGAIGIFRPNEGPVGEMAFSVNPHWSIR